ncbi:magnesium/cobalt transporter CorA [Calothrix sp. 336/3]|uniref:magnesium/cobalt transporter CorA n=1 Tax=Calothrix sp. 336/3 TaxID=1337936 RepID=UPI0004E357AD|nr:magnesium/cobalt transporter CorA [Calothrix sp. 336/3]
MTQEKLDIEEDDNEIDDYYHHPGLIPGEIVIDEDASLPVIVLIDYCAETVIRQEINNPEECVPYLDSESVSWVDVQGLGSAAILQRLGKVFDLHPLILEDIVNVPERPKVEDYEDQIVIISRMVMPRKKGGFYSEQVSFVLGKSYLLTVQEEPERDSFEPVRSRLLRDKGIIRKQGADYLAYALLDAIIDGFFPVLEMYGDRIEELEEEAITNPSKNTLNKIYKIRRELLQVRRAIWPQRDAINSLIRDGHDLINEEVRIYLKDCYDHTIQIIDMVENYREIASGLMDVYLSAVGNKMNEIMKVLTVVSTIFIPLTFIVGIYGMNFNTDKSPYNMPELDWYWGYAFCWGIMILIATILLFLFWRWGWLQNSSRIDRN